MPFEKYHVLSTFEIVVYPGIDSKNDLKRILKRLLSGEANLKKQQKTHRSKKL